MNFFGVLNTLARKKLWFESIKWIESRSNLQISKMHQYFNALGFVYYNMQRYDLAKLYYIEALEFKKDYIVALQNLAKLYEVLDDGKSAMSAYKRILKYDPSNKFAERYLKT